MSGSEARADIQVAFARKRMCVALEALGDIDSAVRWTREPHRAAFDRVGNTSRSGDVDLDREGE